MFEIIQQNPIVSLVLMVVPIVAATWKVMDVLFVKPRDFRIAVLEKSVDEIRREIQKNERADQAKTQGSMPDVSNDTNTESLTNSISEKVAEKSTLLNDFDTFYAAWKNKGLTDLQRDHFEKSFVGQKVFWDVKINSISEESDGYLWCSVGSVNKELSIEHAIAVFEPKYKEALLMVNTGEVVKYTGTIDSFSLSPVIKNSGISKH